jgi:Ala-tRNA(Pro) deacylase
MPSSERCHDDRVGRRRYGVSASDAVTAALTALDIGFELLPHAPVETALAEARVLHVAPEEVAKTVVVRTGSGYLRAVLPASERLDLRKLRGLVGGDKHTHLAAEEDLQRDYPEFQLGAIPPFGGARSDPIVVDRRLIGLASVVVEAGTHDASIRLSTQDLMRVAGEPLVADICQGDER